MWVQVFAGLIAKPAKGARGSVNGDPKWTEVRMRHTYPAQTLPRTGRAVISPGYWGRGIGTLRSLWSRVVRGQLLAGRVVAESSTCSHAREAR